MPDSTYFVALPFVSAPSGPEPGDGVECQSASVAIMRAEALSGLDSNVGSVAFGRTFDADQGTVYGKPIILRTFGQVPDDLSMLI